MTPPDSSALIRVKPSHLHFNGIMQVIRLHLEDTTLTRFTSWPWQSEDASPRWNVAAEADKKKKASLTAESWVVARTPHWLRLLNDYVGEERWDIKWWGGVNGGHLLRMIKTGSRLEQGEKKSFRVDKRNR